MKRSAGLKLSEKSKSLLLLKGQLIAVCLESRACIFTTQALTTQHPRLFNDDINVHLVPAFVQRFTQSFLIAMTWLLKKTLGKRRRVKNGRDDTKNKKGIHENQIPVQVFFLKTVLDIC